MKTSFIDFKKLFSAISIFKNLPWFFGRHAFIVILSFALFAAVLGWLLFYSYVIVVERQEPEISKDSLKFREDIYQEVLNQWQVNEEKAWQK